MLIVFNDEHSYSVEKILYAKQSREEWTESTLADNEKITTNSIGPGNIAVHHQLQSYPVISYFSIADAYKTLLPGQTKCHMYLPPLRIHDKTQHYTLLLYMSIPLLIYTHQSTKIPWI